ncbi:MAG: hypothetical protein U0694_28770 [Anaerolineae bacterium]
MKAYHLRNPCVNRRLKVGETVHSIDDDTIDYVAFADPEVSGTCEQMNSHKYCELKAKMNFAGQLVVRYADGAELLIDA